MATALPQRVTTHPSVTARRHCAVRRRLAGPICSQVVNGNASPSPGDANGYAAGSTPGRSFPEAPSVTTTTLPPPPTWPSLQPPFMYYASTEDAQSNAVPCGLSPIWKVLLLSDGSVTRHLQLLSGSPVTVDCLSMRNVGWSLEGLPPGTELIPGPRVQRQVLLRCCEPEPASGPGPGPGSTQRATVAAAQSECSSNGSSSSSSVTSSGGGAGASNGGECDGVRSSSSSSNSGGDSAPAGGPRVGRPLVYASSWWNADTVDNYLRDKSKPIWMSLSQGHVELYREVHCLFQGHNPELEVLLECEGPFWGRQYIFWSGGRPLTLIYEVFSPRLQQYLGPDEL